MEEILTDFNTTLLIFSFPNTTVPQYLNFKIDLWEDDILSDGLNLGPLGGFCNQGQICDWNDNVCCGVTLFGVCIGIETGDDYRCGYGTLLSRSLIQKWSSMSVVFSRIFKWEWLCNHQHNQVS